MLKIRTITHLLILTFQLCLLEPVENCEVTSIYGHDNRESHSNQFVLSLSKEEWKVTQVKSLSLNIIK